MFGRTVFALLFPDSPFFQFGGYVIFEESRGKKAVSACFAGYACRNMFAAISRISSSDSFGS
jgi:hypothetical protein